MLVLNVEGRVLTPDQMRAGQYILPSEAALAKTLLHGGAWAPTAVPQQPAVDDRPGQCRYSTWYSVEVHESIRLLSPDYLIMTSAACLWLIIWQAGFVVWFVVQSGFRVCSDGSCSSNTSITHQ